MPEIYEDLPIFAAVKNRSVFFFFFLCTLLAKAQNPVTLKLSDTVPVFETLNQDAQPFVLDTMLQRPLVLLFWASWNEPSRQLINELKQAYPVINPVKRAKLQLNIDVIDFCIDTKQDLHQLVLKRENFPWPVHLADYKGWESEIINQLKIQKVPTLLILDENRRIIVADPDIKQLRSTLSNIKVNAQLPN